MSVGSLLFRFPGLMFIAIAIRWHRVDRPSRDGGDYGCGLSVSARPLSMAVWCDGRRSIGDRSRFLPGSSLTVD
jgi:hypothetical protein